MCLHLVATSLWLATLPMPPNVQFKWPDPEIPVPPLVQSYILDECRRYEGFSEESWNECVRGEGFGFRAVVMLLTDPEIGDQMAERYRICGPGLGDLGGRFHRRRAECMSSHLKYVWRFEFTRRTEWEGLAPIRLAEQNADPLP